jgi:hypothetical protein
LRLLRLEKVAPFLQHQIGQPLGHVHKLVHARLGACAIEDERVVPHSAINVARLLAYHGQPPLQRMRGGAARAEARELGRGLKCADRELILAVGEENLPVRL